MSRKKCICNHALHVWCVSDWLDLPGLHRARLSALMGTIGQPASKAYLKAARQAQKTLSTRKRGNGGW